LSAPPDVSTYAPEFLPLLRLSRAIRSSRQHTTARRWSEAPAQEAISPPSAFTPPSHIVLYHTRRRHREWHAMEMLSATNRRPMSVSVLGDFRTGVCQRRFIAIRPSSVTSRLFTLKLRRQSLNEAHQPSPSFLHLCPSRCRIVLPPMPLPAQRRRTARPPPFFHCCQQPARCRTGAYIRARKRQPLPVTRCRSSRLSHRYTSRQPLVFTGGSLSSAEVSPQVAAAY